MARSDWTAWRPQDAGEWIAVPTAEDDKYSRGVLGAITGSDAYPGAAVLGVEAAVRTGVGMVRYVGGERATGFVLQRRPEVVHGMGRVQAWLVGSGMDAARRDADTEDALRHALAQGVPAVVDAGALDLLGASAGPTVVTPHFRELARVLGEADAGGPSAEAIASDPETWAARAAQTLGVTVLLKGARTLVATPDGERLSAEFGPSWLATAGSGDVLGGVLGALLATHAAAIAADGHAALARLAATASLVHGVAAERASAGGPIAALDVAEAVPRVVAELIAGGSGASR
jgi:ADP-dependent NAD(P)H-hydrate dehydratase / NAD(P)H-hydrate epimerase